MSGLRTATDDLNDLLGESANQTASVLDQFGLTVTTGNQAVGSSTSNLATVMYSGADSIADGFQSSTSAIAIGSTQALGYLDNYNIANAGLVTTINTTTTAFSTLNDALNAYKTQTTQATNNAQNNNGDPRTVVGTDWGKFFTTPLPDMLKPGWNANIYANNTQTTNNSTNAGGNAQSGNTYITFTGNVYDKNDISAMVNKGTAAALRRAY